MHDPDHGVLHEAGELIRWAVALTVYPFFLIDDLIHRHEFDEFVAEQRQRFLDWSEGE